MEVYEYMPKVHAYTKIFYDRPDAATLVDILSDGC